MTEHAAGEEKLGRLHEIVADDLIEALTNPTPILNDDGDILGYVRDDKARLQAITFLNNNKIKATPFLSEKISEIEEALKKRKQRFRVVDPGEAAKRAANG